MRHTLQHAKRYTKGCRNGKWTCQCTNGTWTCDNCNGSGDTGTSIEHQAFYLARNIVKLGKARGNCGVCRGTGRKVGNTPRAVPSQDSLNELTIHEITDMPHMSGHASQELQYVRWHGGGGGWGGGVLFRLNDRVTAIYPRPCETPRRGRPSVLHD